MKIPYRGTLCGEFLSIKDFGRVLSLKLLHRSDAAPSQKKWVKVKIREREREREKERTTHVMSWDRYWFPPSCSFASCPLSLSLSLSLSLIHRQLTSFIWSVSLFLPSRPSSIRWNDPSRRREHELAVTRRNANTKDGCFFPFVLLIMPDSLICLPLTFHRAHLGMNVVNGTRSKAIISVPLPPWYIRVCPMQSGTTINIYPPCSPQHHLPATKIGRINPKESLPAPPLYRHFSNFFSTSHEEEKKKSFFFSWSECERCSSDRILKEDWL